MYFVVYVRVTDPRVYFCVRVCSFMKISVLHCAEKKCNFIAVKILISKTELVYEKKNTFAFKYMFCCKRK